MLEENTLIFLWTLCCRDISEETTKLAKEEEGTECKGAKLGKYFDCRGSWLVKKSLSMHSAVYFLVNFRYWVLDSKTILKAS